MGAWQRTDLAEESDLESGWKIQMASIRNWERHVSRVGWVSRRDRISLWMDGLIG